MNLLLALWLAAQTVTPHPAVLDERAFDSRSLARAMSYRVLLPPNYGVSARRYPVLYLLHGLSGGFRDWGDRTRLAAHLAGADIIVIMPNANDSWYVDADAARYEGYVARDLVEEDLVEEDLVEEVDRQFRTVAARGARAIAGLSRGGYGAIKIAIRHPGRFAVAGSFSGAFDVVRDGRQAGCSATRKASYARSVRPGRPGGSRTTSTGSPPRRTLPRSPTCISIAVGTISCCRRTVTS